MSRDSSLSEVRPPEFSSSINFEVCIHRVLKKGGTFTVMLYNRSSINYYAEIMFLRRLFRWLLLPKFMPGLIAWLTGFDRLKLEGHRKILRERKEDKS
jgi:hypothetical protein